MGFGGVTTAVVVLVVVGGGGGGGEGENKYDNLFGTSGQDY